MQTQFAYMPIHWRTDNLAIKPWATKFPKNKQGYTLYEHEHLHPIVGLRLHDARQPARSAEVENLTPCPLSPAQRAPAMERGVGKRWDSTVESQNSPQYRSQRHPIGCLWSVYAPELGVSALRWVCYADDAGQATATRRAAKERRTNREG